MLFSIAYNMPGTTTDAEDMMQETYINWLNSDKSQLENIKYYPLRTISSKCITHLKKLKKERETYKGTWLPEPLLLIAAFLYIQPKATLLKFIFCLHSTARRIIFKPMKHVILLVLPLLFTVIAHSQTIRSGNYSTRGYIKSDGTIQNSSYSTVGYIKKDGTIQNGHYSTIGYLDDDGRVKNSSYSTVGYIKKDGTVQNGSYSTIGYIKEDGTVQNSSRSTIGHASGVKKEWVAIVFFFFELQ